MSRVHLISGLLVISGRSHAFARRALAPKMGAATGSRRGAQVAN